MIALLELLDVSRSVASAKWPTTAVRLRSWGMRLDVGSGSTQFALDRFEFTYSVHGCDFACFNVGYGFPYWTGAVFVRASLDRILSSTSEVAVVPGDA